MCACRRHASSLPIPLRKRHRTSLTFDGPGKKAILAFWINLATGVSRPITLRVSVSALSSKTSLRRSPIGMISITFLPNSTIWWIEDKRFCARSFPLSLMGRATLSGLRGRFTDRSGKVHLMVSLSIDLIEVELLLIIFFKVGFLEESHKGVL